MINSKRDPEIFTDTTVYDAEILTHRLRELAVLNKKLTITFEDKRTDEKPIEYYYEGGIRSYVEYMNRTKEVLHEPIYAEGEDQDISVEIALQYNDGNTSHLYSFANNIDRKSVV